MRELVTVLEAATQARARGEGLLLATVVKVEGSTYRRPGARLLLSEERWLAGAISGGCLERDLVAKAWWRTASGAPALVTYDSTTPDEGVAWSFGLGCNGIVHVLLERLGPAGPLDPIQFVRERLARREPGVLATVFRAEPNTGAHPGDRLLLAPGSAPAMTLEASAPAAAALRGLAERALAAGESRVEELLAGGRLEAFAERLAPPPELVVFGSGYDVAPLVELARSLGWRSVVVASRRGPTLRAALEAADAVVICGPGEAAREVVLGPRSAAVVMTHNLVEDAGYLRAALASPAPYVGILGPRSRTDRLLRDLKLPDGLAARLRAPVGLDLCAEGPEEIALSIVGEVQAVLAGGSAAPLSTRSSPIHPRAAGLP